MHPRISSKLAIGEVIMTTIATTVQDPFFERKIETATLGLRPECY